MKQFEAKKKGNGRKKIEIKRIQKEENRQLCFSKRRQGLFKNANELSILCGAVVGIVVFSRAGKPYSFGHPSADHVFRRFLNIVPPNNPSLTFPTATNCCEPMERELVYLRDNLEVEIMRRGALEEILKKLSKPFGWDCDLQWGRLNARHRWLKLEKKIIFFGCKSSRIWDFLDMILAMDFSLSSL